MNTVLEEKLEGEEDCLSISLPAYTWQCHIFGETDGLCISYTSENAPNGWVRFWSRVFLRSKWVKL